MKTKTTYVCSECGYQSVKWLGRCPGCSSWNTLQETVVSEMKKSSSSVRSPIKIGGEVPEEIRYRTGTDELDRVLGGGIVQGSLILVGGAPGIGKSTLLLQICESVGRMRKILYVSGEESERQVRLRAVRLGVQSENVFLISETDVGTIISCIEDTKPDVVIVDSIQTMSCDHVSSAAGSVVQVREATNALMHIAKRQSIAMFIVGHVTKDGNIAGPRVLEHMVDCVLYFEGDQQSTFRILRAVKNRFGSTNEIGVFDMRDDGLCEVENPSAALLEGRPHDISGSVVVCAMEGSRGVLAEIQGLVTPTGFGNPRRMSDGIDLNRMILMLAVLEKRAGVVLSASDVYVNVAGGLRIDETAVDLGVCIAIATAKKDIVVSSDMIAVGEVGLGGELRSVIQLEKRLSEAAKMGFRSAVVPKMALRGVKVPDGFTAHGAETLAEALAFIRRNSPSGL